MAKPQLTIITAGDRVDRLERSVQALRQQSIPFSCFEVVLATSLTREEIAGVLAPDDQLTVRHFCCGQSNSVGNLNFGAAAARGELLLFLSEEVVADPGLVAAHLCWHGAHPEPRVGVVGATSLPSSPLAPLRTEDDPAGVTTRRHRDVVPAADSLCGSEVSFSVKRSIFEHLGGFDPTLELDSAVDELWVRYHKQGVSWITAPDALVYPRVISDVSEHAARSRRRGQVYYALFQRHPETVLASDLGSLLILPVNEESLVQKTSDFQACNGSLDRSPSSRDWRAFLDGWTALGAQEAAKRSGWRDPNPRHGVTSVASGNGTCTVSRRLDFSAGADAACPRLRLLSGSTAPEFLTILARQVVRLRGSSASPVLALGVDGSDTPTHAHPVVTIEYLDFGEAVWSVQYHRAGEAAEGWSPCPAICTAETIRNEDSGAWRTISMPLAGAVFGLGGGDLQVVVSDPRGSDLILHRVTLEVPTAPPTAAAPRSVEFVEHEAPEVSVIIPAHGQLALTAACLEALREATEGDYEVIVVDNASPDETAEYVSNGTGVRLIRNADNLPFARACNEAARHARGKFLVFLNNDTLPLPGWLTALRSQMRDPEVGVAGSKLVFPNQLRVQHSGIIFSGDSCPRHPHLGYEVFDAAVRRTRTVPAVTGAALLIRNELFRALDGFDERFVNGYEDVDLCLRAAHLGQRTVYCAQSVLYHRGCSTPGRLDYENANYELFSQIWRPEHLEALQLALWPGATHALPARPPRAQPPRPLPAWEAGALGYLATPGAGPVGYLAAAARWPSGYLAFQAAVGSLYAASWQARHFGQPTSLAPAGLYAHVSGGEQESWQLAAAYAAGAAFTSPYAGEFAAARPQLPGRVVPHPAPKPDWQPLVVNHEPGATAATSEACRTQVDYPLVIAWHPFDPECSIGVLTRELVRGLLRSGYVVRVSEEYRTCREAAVYRRLIASPEELDTGCVIGVSSVPDVGARRVSFEVIDHYLAHGLRRHYAENADLLVTNSRHSRDELRRLGVVLAPIHSFQLGVDAERFHPEAQPWDWRSCVTWASGPIPEDPFVVLTHGFWQERKGLCFVIEAYQAAFRDLAEAASPPVLLVKGIPRLWGKDAQPLLKRWVDPSGPVVILVEAELPPHEMPGVYTAADLLLHLHREEGFGLVPLEAMACGLPVVVTDYGGVREFATSESCVLIPPRSVGPMITDAMQGGEDLWRDAKVEEAAGTGLYCWAEPDVETAAAALRSLYESPESRAQLGLAARRRSLEFSWDRAAERLVRALEQGGIRIRRRALSLQEPALISLCIAAADEAPAVSRLIRSIVGRTQIPDGYAVEIVLVDDASTDGLAEWTLQAEKTCNDLGFPLRYIRHPRKEGRVASLNHAWFAARGEYLCSLAANVEISNVRWLYRLVAGGGTGVVGAKLLGPDGEVLHTGCIADTEGIPWVHRGYQAEDAGRPGSREQVAAVSSALMFFPACLLQQVGGLDAHYPEGELADIDWCLEVRQSGYPVEYDPSVSAVLYDSETTLRNPAIWQHASARFHAKWPDGSPADPNPGPTTGDVCVSAVDAPASGVQRNVRVAWHAPFGSGSGFGADAETLFGCLAGEPAYHLHTLDGEELGNGWMAPGRAGESAGSPDLLTPEAAISQYWISGLRLYPGASLNVARTTFETDSLPPVVVRSLEPFDRLWVPSRFNREAFIRSGLCAERIRVIPEAISEAYLFPGSSTRRLPGSERFRFLSVFDWTLRKGWDVLLRAFVAEFGSDPSVGLVLKVGSGPCGYSLEAIKKQADELLLQSFGRSLQEFPNIHLWQEHIPTEEMPALYRAADAFVLPTRGEGWCRPLMEAMACELPCLATDWGGFVDYYDASVGFPVPCAPQDVSPAAAAEYPLFRGLTWVEPDPDALREQMRRVLAEPDEARRRGRLARKRILGRYRPSQIAPLVRDELAQQITSVTLRRSRTFPGKPAGHRNGSSASSEILADAPLACGRSQPERLGEVVNGSHTADPNARLAESAHHEREPVALARGPRMPLVWHGPLLDPSGYADEGRQFVFGLLDAGQPVMVCPLDWTEERVALESEKAAALRSRSVRLDTPAEIAVCHAPPHLLRRSENALLNIARTMWETEGLPPGALAGLSRMDRIWVPSTFQQERLVEHGIREDRIAVVPELISPSFGKRDAAPWALPGTERFRFLSVLDWSLRKGWDVALEAFVSEFGADPSVGLVLKIWNGSLKQSRAAILQQIEDLLRARFGRGLSELRNIHVWWDIVPVAEWPRVYRAADAFVLPSRGEGWCRPLVEAMASGCPSIATGWGAVRDYFGPEVGFPIDYQVTPVSDAAARERAEYAGQRWAEPDVDHLRYLLRRVVEHPQEAREKAEAARTLVLGGFTPKAGLQLLLQELDHCRKRIGAIQRESTRAQLTLAGR